MLNHLVMSKPYSVIKIKDKQFFVTEGDVIKTYPISTEKEIEILLLKDKDALILGDPIVEKGGVEITVLGDKKIKTEVRRYKSKSRYRKNKSHSQNFLFCKITKISSTAKGVKFIAEDKKAPKASSKKTIKK